MLPSLSIQFNSKEFKTALSHTLTHKQLKGRPVKSNKKEKSGGFAFLKVGFLLVKKN